MSQNASWWSTKGRICTSTVPKIADDLPFRLNQEKTHYRWVQINMSERKSNTILPRLTHSLQVMLCYGSEAWSGSEESIAKSCTDIHIIKRTTGYHQARK
jgi:hypothetical protein